MVKDIQKMLRSLIRWASRDDYPSDAPMEISSSSMTKSMSGSSIRDGVNGMNFMVYSATGGKVVEMRTYDPRTDRHNTNLYVVTDKEDLGEELAQIITRESLSR